MIRLRFWTRALLWVCIVALFSGCKKEQRPVAIQSLLRQMVDRSHLARYPDPYYETGQFSSYDRRSKRKGGPGWFANLDRTHFLRTEQHRGRTEYVMMDTAGPGALTRFWMTFAGPGAGQGTLRIYLDHDDQPVIEGKAMDILSGGKLVAPPLAASVSPKTDYKKRGHNLYLPIPYRENIKITYQSERIGKPGAPSGGEAVYYNINFRTYEQGTPVYTFTQRRLENARPLLDSVQRSLERMNHQKALQKYSLQYQKIEAVLAPGSTYTTRIDSPGAIRQLVLRVAADHCPQALRSTVLEIRFDGRTTVWTPIGDFFGTGYQIRPHTTWYTQVSQDGTMEAYWVMPFQKSATLKLHNFGDQAVTVEGRLAVSKWRWTDRSMHFGSTWRGETGVETGQRKKPDGSGGPFDINYTHLKGKGVYVGDVLTLYNTAYAWWGEGDEKIYIDGESFPSHFGTGTEDYYGYAWASPAAFTDHPFIAQPDGSGNLKPGYTVNLRYRSLDAIPFEKELNVDMELWHWVNTTIDYAVATFFYTRPNAEILVTPDTAAVRQSVALQRSDIIPNTIRDGKLEGEQLALDTLTGGSIKYQNLPDAGWSQNKQLWWLNAAPGDRLRLTFQSRREGTFHVKGRFTKAHDYGTFTLGINGTKVGTYSLYSDSLRTTTLDLGKHHIHKGTNRVTITLEEYSPREKKAFWGLDYLIFK